jgi:hypothetical protein
MWELGTRREDNRSKPVISLREDTAQCKDSHIFPALFSRNLERMSLRNYANFKINTQENFKSQLRQQSVEHKQCK